MKTAAKMVTVGSEWLSGNTFNPTHETVKALLSWDQVPAYAKKTWRTIEYWFKNETEFSSRVWVKTSRCVVPMDVFVATRFVSHDAMCETYPESRKSSFLWRV